MTAVVTPEAGACEVRETPLPVDGAAAPPRANGELVFAQPWQSRAFGMVVTLHDSGAFEWPVFQSALIARIAAWEAAHPDGDGYSYYDHWLAALEDVLDGGGTLARADVEVRAGELADRPAGYDHADAAPGQDDHGHGDHGHGHGHGHGH